MYLLGMKQETAFHIFLALNGLHRSSLPLPPSLSSVDIESSVPPFKCGCFPPHNCGRFRVGIYKQTSNQFVAGLRPLSYLILKTTPACLTSSNVLRFFRELLPTLLGLILCARQKRLLTIARGTSADEAGV